MNYRSVADLNSAILRGLWKVPLDVELVVGIPRSGMLAASILALHRNLPLTDLEGFLNNKVYVPGATGRIETARDLLGRRRKVIVIDDSLYSGDTLCRCRSLISQAYVNHDVRYSVVYVSPNHEKDVDIYFEQVGLPRVFEWNLMGSALLGRTCFDLDGVFCRDPRPEENDDGALYEKFIESVDPLWIPRREVGWVVTSRLEKYREATVQWLARQQIKYRNLIMLDLPDKESRLASGCSAAFKAAVYSSVDADLFVESYLSQALEIARITSKNVLCVETSEMIQASLVNEYRVRAHSASASIKDSFMRITKRTLRLVANLSRDSGTRRG